MMTRSLLFIAAVLSPSNQENIQTDGDERKTMEDLTGSFPFSLSTNCLAADILKTLCEENGFQGDSFPRGRRRWLLYRNVAFCILTVGGALLR